MRASESDDARTDLRARLRAHMEPEHSTGSADESLPPSVPTGVAVASTLAHEPATGPPAVRSRLTSIAIASALFMEFIDSTALSTLGFSSRWTPSMSLCGVDLGGWLTSGLLFALRTGGGATRLRKKIGLECKFFAPAAEPNRACLVVQFG